MVGDDSVRIPRPPQDVFAVLSDGEQNPRWRLHVVRSHRVRGDGGVGTEWQMETRNVGRRIREYIVEEWRPPTLYVVRYLTGRTRGTAAYTLTEQAGETVVALHVQSRSTGLYRIVGGTAPREMAADLDDLKRLRDYLTSDQEAAASPS